MTEPIPNGCAGIISLLTNETAKDGFIRKNVWAVDTENNYRNQTFLCATRFYKEDSIQEECKDPSYTSCKNRGLVGAEDYVLGMSIEAPPPVNTCSLDEYF